MGCIIIPFEQFHSEYCVGIQTHDFSLMSNHKTISPGLPPYMKNKHP